MRFLRKLIEVKSKETNYESKLLYNADFSGQTLKKFNFAEASFSPEMKSNGDRYHNNRFNNATIIETSFALAHLAFADFSGATIVGSNFFGADARFTKFRDSKIDKINFSAADLRFADFRNCTYSNLIFDENTLLIGHDLPAQKKLAAAFLEKLDKQISSRITDSAEQQTNDYFKKMHERMHAISKGKHGAPAKLFFLVQQWIYKESSAKRTAGFIAGIFKETLVEYRNATHAAATALRNTPCKNFTALLEQESAQSAAAYADQLVAHYEAVTMGLTNSVIASRTTPALFKPQKAETDDGKKDALLPECSAMQVPETINP